MIQFEMTIKEIFNFQDGRIIFVGDVDGESNFITECECQLMIDDHLFTKIHIEGEMLPYNTKTELRTISTKDEVDISNLPYKNNKVKLRCMKYD